MNEKTQKIAAAKLRRAAAARDKRKQRAAVKARLMKELDREYRLAKKQVLTIAETGRPVPIHFDVRLISGTITVEKRYSLTGVNLYADCFTDETLADDIVISARTRDVPPDVVHEFVVANEQSPEA